MMFLLAATRIDSLLAAQAQTLNAFNSAILAGVFATGTVGTGAPTKLVGCASFYFEPCFVFTLRGKERDGLHGRCVLNTCTPSNPPTLFLGFCHI